MEINSEDDIFTIANGVLTKCNLAKKNAGIHGGENKSESRTQMLKRVQHDMRRINNGRRIED